MKGYGLEEKELLDENHFPVLIVLNMISEKRFLGILEAISQGIGFGEEYGACTMPDDMDDYDKSNGECLEGIEFGLHSGEEVVIDYLTFYYYLTIISEKYIKRHVNHEIIVKGFLKDYTNKFLQ